MKTTDVIRTMAEKQFALIFPQGIEHEHSDELRRTAYVMFESGYRAGVNHGKQAGTRYEASRVS